MIQVESPKPENPSVCNRKFLSVYHFEKHYTVNNCSENTMGIWTQWKLTYSISKSTAKNAVDWSHETISLLKMQWKCCDKMNTILIFFITFSLRF